MKVRFIIKEEVVQPEDVKTKEDIQTEISAMLPELDGNQLAALQKYAMELQNSVTEGEKFTKKDIKKRDDIAKSISTKSLEKRYGVGKDKAEDIKYAIASSTVKKSKKKKKWQRVNTTTTLQET